MIKVQSAMVVFFLLFVIMVVFKVGFVWAFFFSFGGCQVCSLTEKESNSLWIAGNLDQ